jgi:hypothetical protein
VTIQKQFGFDYTVPLEVEVIHWDSLETKNVVLTSNFATFYTQVCLKFSSYIVDSARLYTLPRGFEDIDQRKRVDTEEAYSELLQAIVKSVIKLPPLLYLWTAATDTSPIMLPETQNDV